MLLPLGMLRAMHITTAQKWGLAGVAGLVVIDIIFDILRTIFTIGSYATTFPNANAVWALCEPSIAVMICGLPIYRSLLSRKTQPTSTSYEEIQKERNSKKINSRTTPTTPYEMDTMNMSTHDSVAALRHQEEM